MKLSYRWIITKPIIRFNSYLSITNLFNLWSLLYLRKECWGEICKSKCHSNCVLCCVFVVISIKILVNHRGSNWGFSTRGTALTRYVFIECYDSGNNSDSNACRSCKMDSSTSEPLLRWKPVLSFDEISKIYLKTHLTHPHSHETWGNTTFSITINTLVTLYIN